jgi:hypothetical protein
MALHKNVKRWIYFNSSITRILAPVVDPGEADLDFNAAQL